MTALGPLPEPEILVKKVRVKGHGGHHGGAWKVAYADFVTAMMAFFLLMWLLGATDEEKRKGIADYFAPAVIESESSSGSNGVMNGRSLEEPDGSAPHARRSRASPAAPFHAGQPKTGEAEAPRKDNRAVEAEIRRRLSQDPGLKSLEAQVRFVDTPEGLRIELVDKADYSMFTTGTAAMDPRARKLLAVVADVIAETPQKLAIRGHTDAVPFSARREGAPTNNWTLSSARAEATRQALSDSGVPADRFARLEGVAETDPFNSQDPYDPRNRRMSVTLLRE
jgi:chemotaxis protein MotB